MLRILRGLGSQALACGCLVGIYETYGNQTIAIVDAKGTGCPESAHKVDSAVEVAPASLNTQPPNTMPTMSR